MPSGARKSRRRYSDAFRSAALAALDANRGNLERTARELKVPKSTLEGWAKGTRNPVDPQLRTQKKADLADELEAFVLRLCQIRPEQLRNLTVKDAAIAIGVGIDKLLLLRGKPNQHTKVEEAIPTLTSPHLNEEERYVLSELQRKSQGGRAPGRGEQLGVPVHLRR